MIEINLLSEQRELPAAAKTEAPALAGLLIGSLVLILSCALVVFLYIRTKNYIKDLESQVTQAQQEKTRLDEDLKKVDELEKIKLAAENRFKAIETLAKGRTLPVHILMEFSRAITELAWLETFEVSGMSFKAKGYARQERAVVDLVDRLNQSSYFTGVTLLEWRSEPGKEEIGTFSIQGNLINPVEKILSAGQE